MRTILFTFLILSASINILAQNTRSSEDANGLPVGVKAPVFQAIDADSITFNLDLTLKKGPVVLIFYRGNWCPVCNKHLKQVQDSLLLISEMGATVVAVSPEKPEYLRKMKEKTGASFSLLYDEGYKISDAYDVTFTPEKKQKMVYNTFLKANLKEVHSDNSQRLPIPVLWFQGPFDRPAILGLRPSRMAWRKSSILRS